MLSRLIIKWLSATADGSGRESADRIAARSNRNGIQRNSVSGELQNRELYTFRFAPSFKKRILNGGVCFTFLEFSISK